MSGLIQQEENKLLTLNLQHPMEVPEPILVIESFVTSFKFWDGDIKNGMFYRNELYRQHQTFTKDRRRDVFDIAYQLTSCNFQVVITQSQTQYTVWKSLRSFHRHLAD